MCSNTIRSFLWGTINNRRMLFLTVRYCPVTQLLSFPNCYSNFALYPNCVKKCPLTLLFEYFLVSQLLSFPNWYYDFACILTVWRLVRFPNCSNIFLYHNYLCSNVTKICLVSQLSKDLSYSPTVRIFLNPNCYFFPTVTKILPVSQMCEDLPDPLTVRIFSCKQTPIFSQLLLRFCLYPKCVKTCPIPQLFEYFPVSQLLSLPNFY